METTLTLTERTQEALFQARASRERPLTELALAEMFGVSRSPIRDALKALEKDGLVERKKKKGVYLKAPTLAEIIEIHDIRSVLEGFAARLACEQLTDDQLAELQRHAETFEAAQRDGDVGRARVADTAFHRIIVEASGSGLLMRILKNFQLLRRAFAMRQSSEAFSRVRTDRYPHARIVRTLAERDPDACEQAMRLHIQASKRSLVEDSLHVRLEHFDENPE
jgi:DNA-binding GntR family transcriptional regulator